MDILAWIIIAVFYAFAAVPAIGDLFASNINTYTEALKIGAAIHIVILGFAAIVSAFVWAVIRVTS